MFQHILISSGVKWIGRGGSPMLCAKRILPTISTSLLLLAMSVLCCGEALADTALNGQAIEVSSVITEGAYLNVRNLSNVPIGIWVCDNPERLSEFGYEIQWLTANKEWKRARPRASVVHGDLHPRLLQIHVGQSFRVPALFLARFSGIAHGMTLRVVIRAWKQENRLASGMPTKAGQEPLLLISAPFSFMPSVNTD